jgi:hypothetical protein
MKYQALKAHPLWPTFKKWAHEGLKHIVPFELEDKFQTNVDLAVLLNPLWGHAEAKEGFRQTYRNAETLGNALVGGPCTPIVHAMVYQAAQHSLGEALCHAAMWAQLLPDQCADFAASTRLEGFVSALEAWAGHFMRTGFVGIEELPWVINNLVGKYEQPADFWLGACQQDIGNSAVYVDAVSKNKRKADDAARKKGERKRNPKDAEFKDVLRCFWLPAALWCKSTADIVILLAPKERHSAAAIERVRRDIHELGFTASHRKSPE